MGQQGPWGKGPEDERRWRLGKGDGRFGPEVQVDEDDEEGEEDEVDWRYDRDAGRWVSIVPCSVFI